MIIYTFGGYSCDSGSFALTEAAVKHYFGKPMNVMKKDGAPIICEAEEHISVAHTGNYLFIAVSLAAVGIDSEKIVERNYEKIAAKFGWEPKNVVDFYEMWTAYEARFKKGDADAVIRYFYIFPGVITCVAGGDENILFCPMEQFAYNPA